MKRIILIAALIGSVPLMFAKAGPLDPPLVYVAPAPQPPVVLQTPEAYKPLPDFPRDVPDIKDPPEAAVAKPAPAAKN